MDPNANPIPAPPQPIQDVVPPRDNLGNPENGAALPSHNPIAGTAMAQSQSLHDSQTIDPALDSVLKDVTSNIKSNPPTPVPHKGAKRGMFGIFKKQPKSKLPPTNLAPHSPVHQPPAHPPAPAPSQQAPALPANPVKPGLKSGAMPAKKKGKMVLPVVVAVIVAIVLVAAALSAFKN